MNISAGKLVSRCIILLNNLKMLTARYLLYFISVL